MILCLFQDNSSFSAVKSTIKLETITNNLNCSDDQSHWLKDLILVKYYQGVLIEGVAKVESYNNVLMSIKKCPKIDHSPASEHNFES